MTIQFVLPKPPHRGCEAAILRRRPGAALGLDRTPPATRLTEVAKLIDVSKCIGCKACQVAFVEWNDLHEPVGVQYWHL